MSGYKVYYCDGLTNLCILDYVLFHESIYLYKTQKKYSASDIVNFVMQIGNIAVISRSRLVILVEAD